ncbi:MAG: transglutaminase TgpA family protein [Heyndrickxia sp.]
MRQPTRDSIGFIIILYVFSFFLLWEWIRPLETITDTGNVYLFVLFILMSFALYMFNIRKGIDITLKLFFIFISLHHLYYQQPLYKLSWMKAFGENLMHNLKRLFSGNLDLLSGEFRSLLFFILLWLITYLLKYWLLTRRNVFIFFVMTVIYITVLDTFTPYHGEWPIVRTIIIGFALLGVLYYKRLSEQNRVANTKSNWIKWMVPLTIMISICTLFALAAPKVDAIWPDPVPYINAHVGKDKQNGRGSGGAKTVGYRSDDSHLGGPFQGDNTIVFRAKAPSRQYWRIETRDIYTGKGWVSNTNVPTDIFQSGSPAKTSVSHYTIDKDTKMESANIQFKGISQTIVYPYGLQSIVTKNGDVSFATNTSTDKLTLFSEDPKKGITDYTVNYYGPQYSIKELKAPPLHEFTPPQEYLYLPNFLPQRVRDLAQKIIAGKDNEYDKAKAIEQYFQMNGFVYDQKNVAIPKDNQDYVDQFLFETKRGYCDNFSTSMVVLLRSVGIPARWVKGYSGGDYVDTVDDTYKLYDVTNNNAHSWVEVLFPNVGWVPFEPTIGFSNNAIFKDDQSNKAVNSTSPDDEMKKNQMQKKPTEQASQQNTSTTEKFSLKAEWNKVWNYMKLHWLRFVIILLVIVVAFWYIYWKRNKWLPFYLVYRYRRRTDSDTFSKAYLSLLKQLERYGVRKQNGQTLREFAKKVDTLFETNAMWQLTEHYERVIYRGQNTGIKWEETRELWENLIKKTSG